MTLSKNGVGYATLLVVVFGFVGVDIGIETAGQVVTSVMTLVSFGLMFWNQVTRPDVKKFFFKK